MLKKKGKLGLHRDFLPDVCSKPLNLDEYYIIFNFPLMGGNVKTVCKPISMAVRLNWCLQKLLI